MAGNKSQAKKYLLGIKDTIRQVETRKKDYPADVFYIWKAEPVLEVSPNLQSSWREAQQILQSIQS